MTPIDPKTDRPNDPQENPPMEFPRSPTEPTRQDPRSAPAGGGYPTPMPDRGTTSGRPDAPKSTPSQTGTTRPSPTGGVGEKGSGQNKGGRAPGSAPPADPKCEPCGD